MGGGGELGRFVGGGWSLNWGLIVSAHYTRCIVSVSTDQVEGNR